MLKSYRQRFIDNTGIIIALTIYMALSVTVMYLGYFWVQIPFIEKVGEEILMWASALAESCIYVALISLWPAARKPLTVIAYALATLSILPTLVCGLASHCQIAPLYYQILVNTNSSEASEYFKLIPVWSILMCLTIGLLGAVAGWWLWRRVSEKLRPRIWLSAIVTGGISALATLFIIFWFPPEFMTPISGCAFKSIQAAHYYNGVTQYEYVTPEVEYTSAERPHNIVLIIGESLSKDHTSLYGYDKVTTPELDSIAATDTSFIIFKEAISPGLHTIEAFSHFFVMPIDDNRAVTIPDMARAAGYATVWLSSQHRDGEDCDNVSAMAARCDTTHWLWEKGLIDYDYLITKDVDGVYDEGLLPILDKAIASASGSDHMYIINLMGSHPWFQNRYPQGFARFIPADYPKAIESQRPSLAAYDNSVAYNDSIVREIISRFEDKDAVVIYFSDHGLDVYVSSPDMAAHGVDGNPVSERAASRIPLLIYPSRSYRERSPHGLDQAAALSTGPYNTDSIMKLLAPIMGIQKPELH